MKSTIPQQIGSKRAAEILKVDRSNIGRLVRTGTLKPSTKLEGSTGAYLFDEDHVQKVAADRRAKRAEAAG
ncbi:hypothetical protein [Agromyces sp. SYSU T00194]|uniref:hypothetical protein n=1 Tax=Agromyces chitinivorans TaxID=3158560 RepID=UPI003399C95C